VGISAVVQAEPAAWLVAVVGGEDAVFGAVVVVPVLDVDSFTAPGFWPVPDEDVAVPAELVLAGVVVAAPVLLAAVLEHPAVSAAAPSAPAATKTEIRFMEPNLSG
jgi:hypothetical protein